MGRPSRTTFLKRQKEMARSEKRMSKLARRQKSKDEANLDANAQQGAGVGVDPQDEPDGTPSEQDDAEGQDTE